MRTLLLFVPLSFLVACGSDKPAATPTGATQVTASPSADPLVATVRAAPAATAVPNGAATDSPLTKGLKETAAWFAPGMTADGPLYTAKLAPKGHARADVTLRTTSCYVFVGFSQDGQVTDYDLHLLTTTPPAPLAEDTDDDTTPTIGKPPFCPSADGTYWVDLFADKGSGDVVMQVYAKNK